MVKNKASHDGQKIASEAAVCSSSEDAFSCTSSYDALSIAGLALVHANSIPFIDDTSLDWGLEQR